MPSERLSDEELDELLRDNTHRHARWPDAYALADEVAALVAELKERRAAERTAGCLNCECWSQPHAGFCPAREG